MPQHLKILILAAAAIGLAGAGIARPAPRLRSVQTVPPPITYPAANIPNWGIVSRYYAARRDERIWFRNGVRSPAASRLMTILQRAPVDGLQSGPQLASEVQQAIQLAQLGTAPAISHAERVLSAAWVTYVQVIRAMPRGIEFADERLIPDTAADRVLSEAATAPVLDRYVAQTSDVNPTYAQLRDAAWSLARITGGALDPRTAATLARARMLPANGRYVVVDLASQQLYMYDNGIVSGQMKVIVGKTDHPTPLIASTIHYATFNPYWNPPADLIREKIAPGVLREGLGYLRIRDYEVVSGWESGAPVISPTRINWAAVAAGQERVRIRKKPGAYNPMGRMKFSFENSADIYLHDTPEKALFGNAQRTLSLGCIRLQDAERFAEWLLAGVPMAPSDIPESHVQLKQGIPVYLTYLTARLDGGSLAFASDIYGLDGGDIDLASSR